jgi:hypothetical protein
VPWSRKENQTWWHFNNNNNHSAINADDHDTRWREREQERERGKCASELKKQVATLSLKWSMAK